MNRKSYHVVPAFSGGWGVLKEGALRLTKRFGTKEEAITAAREMSRKQETQLYIHRSDGQISYRHSYGPEPASTKIW